MCDLINETNKLINNYLKSFNIYQENPAWIINESPYGNRGIFATRDISPGEIIFKDKPLIIGPRFANDQHFICVICYNPTNGRICSNGCGLLLCCDGCEKSSKHSKECEIILKWKNSKSNEVDFKLLKCLCPIRSLLLNDDFKELAKTLMSHQSKSHGLEVNTLIKELNFNISKEDEYFMRLICSIFDTNAFEIAVGNSSFRALFPLASLINHNCVPKATYVFDNNQTMIVKASCEIKKGEEIYITYSRLIWSTFTRRYFLNKTKHFQCICNRCKDPTELGSHISSFICQICDGLIVHEEPLKLRSNWKCLQCNNVTDSQTIGNLLSALGGTLKNFSEDDVIEKMEFLDKKLKKFVCPNNEICVVLKYNLIWILGHRNGYKLNELSDELINKKMLYCQDIINILKILGTGLCKMRGLLLFELGCCLRELNNRQKCTNNNNNSDFENIFRESRKILEGDVAIPKELLLLSK